MTRELRGVFPILNTTFHDDGSLDFSSQENLVRYLVEQQGASGLGLFGNASEGYALEDRERMELLKHVRRAAGKTPLVASTGHSGTHVAIELSRKAEDLGADALMVLPPSFMKTDADGLLFYYDAISKAVNIPIMIQDAPLMTGVAMPAALLARMAREIENVQYAKVEGPPTTPKVSAVVKAGGMVVFGGLNGNFFIEEYHRGARGVMPGSDMIGYFVQIWNALESGDETTAWRIFTRILPLIRFELQPGLGVCAMKNNLKAARVIRSAHVRHPTGRLDETALRELAHLRDWIGSEQPLAALES